MTEFKKGDRAVIEVEVDVGHNGQYLRVRPASGAVFWVDPGDLKVAPYRDPDLAPGQVVVPEDESDERSWWVRRGVTTGELYFFPPAHGAASRAALPERIRVVWPR